MSGTTDERALQAVELALREMVSSAPLLAPVLDMLVPTSHSGALVACDGHRLFFDPDKVAALVRDTRALPTREVTHVVCHLLLGHPFRTRGTDPKRFALATDVVAEAATAELLGRREDGVGQAQEAVCNRLRQLVGSPLSTTRLMASLPTRVSDEELDALAAPFHVDDHAPWYAPRQTGKDGAEPPRGVSEPHSPGAGDQLARACEEAPDEDVRERWERMARTVSAQAAREQVAGTLVRELGAPGRTERDYASFLTAFRAITEVARPSEVDFDPIFYTLGLELYGNLPLIEPLELTEQRSARTLVVALDTSASIGSDLLTHLLDVTFDVVRATCTGGKTQVCILQADARVQDETYVRTPAELARWRREVSVRGFGGTDFRPAIARAQEIAGRDGSVSGLVYLTDGFGIYPDTVPPFPVAFVYTDTTRPPAPAWVIPHTLTTTDIVAAPGTARH